MGQMTLCNPDTRITKHISISIEKMNREASRFVGMCVPTGAVFATIFDVHYFTRNYPKTHLTFGEQFCRHKENKTGTCTGHNQNDEDAPKDFAVTDKKRDDFDFFESIKNGKTFCYPLIPELEQSRTGDFITLENHEKTEKIKLLITCGRIAVSNKLFVCVKPVFQRTNNKGKIQYQI